MATFCSGFVDANATEVREVHAFHRSLDVVLHDPPEPRVVLADEAGNGCDRHVRDERHGKRLEQQREAGARPRPGNGNLLDATVGTRDAGHARVQVGLVLEEVEMPPLLHRRVVHRAIGLGAIGARKAAAAREVDPDIEALLRNVELARLDHPRRHKTESKLEQFDVTHVKLLVPVRIDPAIVLVAVKE